MTMDVLRLAVEPIGSCMEQDRRTAERPGDAAGPELLHAAFREMNQAMAILSLSDGVPRLVEINSDFARYTGIVAEGARAADFLSLVPFRPANMAGLRELRHSLGNNRPLVTRLTFAASDETPVELILRPLSTRRDASFLCILRPVRQVAPVADAAIADRLLSFLSHDLRTPLNGILGFSEIMMTDLLGPLAPEDYRAYARDIHEAGQDLLHLVNGLLDISHFQAGGLQLRDELFSLRDCMGLCLDAVRAKAGAADVTIRRAIARDLPAFRGDELRLRQIFTILLSNAVAVSPRGGRVTFRAWHDHTGLRLTCSDSGRGVTPRELARAWPPGRIEDPYGDPQLSTGLGIGLPLVRVLVERHDGTLSVSSKPGHGTRISLHFPMDRLVRRA